VDHSRRPGEAGPAGTGLVPDPVRGGRAGDYTLITAPGFDMLLPMAAFSLLLKRRLAAALTAGGPVADRC
jgi:ABC-type glycerol-3-phosphate transport system permease component